MLNISINWQTTNSFLRLEYLTLKSDLFLAQHILLTEEPVYSIPNYLVINIITNVSIVSNPHKYVIIRECSNMTVSYDKYNFLSLREW